MVNKIEGYLADLERTYAALRSELGEARFHDFLEYNAGILLQTSGIGAGADVTTSGEDAAINLLARNQTTPLCIFDVGSNYGQFASLILAHDRLLPIKLHCFEPSQKAFEQLSERFSSDQRVRLNNLAISDSQGQTSLFSDSAGSGLASLSKRRLDHFGITFDQSETVRKNTIDSYCREHEIRRINLLKLDIEGHEISALYGARGMLQRKSIDMVMFEFGGANIDSRTYFQDFFYFFTEHEMKLFRVTPSGHLHPIDMYREFYEQFVTTNFVAIADSNLLP